MFVGGKKMKIHLMDKTKKKKFLAEVGYLGKLKTKNLFLMTGLEKIRAYSGSLSKDEIMALWRMFPIEGLGMYFGKLTINRHGVKEARLSTDALHLMKDQITDNILDLDEEQVLVWFSGKNFELKGEQKKFKDYVAVRFEKDFIGTGKVSRDGVLQNFLPKERRIREN